MKIKYHAQTFRAGLCSLLATCIILNLCVSCSSAEMLERRRQLYADLDKQFLELLASAQSEMGKEILRYERKGMLSVIRAAQLRSGRSRTLWTSGTDLSKKRMDVRYLGENYQMPHVFELNR